ncbi:MAG: hypothetical protein ACYC9O_16460 [Candidatus Latescibacterota bacterium]
MGILKPIGYSFGTAVVVSFIVLFLGMLVFGMQLNEWTEWQGRIIGAAATIAGIAGAVAGLRLALHS